MIKGKFIKFVCVGISNTIISLVIYYLLNAIGFNYIISMGCGYVISSITGYLLNKHWVFEKKSEEKSIFRYYVVYFLALFLNLSLMNFFVEIIGFSKDFAPLPTIFITTIFNYLLSNFWVFNKNKISFRNIKDEVSNHKLYYLLVVIFLLFISLVFINNLYNNPVADDYTNYNTASSFVSDGKISNIEELVTATYKMSLNTYETWQGTYFSNFLFPLNPILLSRNMYKFTMFIIQIVYLISNYFFITSFKTSKKDKKKYDIIYMMYTIFSLMFMYSLGEGLYWYTGAALYIIPYCLSVILFGLISRYLRNNNKYLLALIVILTVFLGGTSYVTGLFVGFVYFLIAVYFFYKNDKRKYKFLILLVLFGICFAFNVFCPGNQNRVLESSGESSFIRIILVNSWEMIRHLFFETLYIPFMVIIFPVIKELIKNSNKKYDKPYILIFASIVCFLLLFAPMAYAYKNFYQETRVKNIQLMYLVIMCTVCFINYYGYFYKTEKVSILNKRSYILIGVALSVVMFKSLDNVSGKILFDDILYRRSKTYDECMEKINYTLSNSKSDTTVVSNCSVYPQSLHYYVLENDSWITDGMSVYYKTKIIVEE